MFSTFCVSIYPVSARACVHVCLCLWGGMLLLPIWLDNSALKDIPSGHFNVESTLNQRQTSTLKQR